MEQRNITTQQQYHLIPNELQVIPRWLVANQSKAPCREENGKLIPVAHNSEGVHYDFETVCAIAAKHDTRIGFCIHEQCGYICLDIDPPASGPTKEYWEYCQRTFEDADTYSEMSSSGKGIHIWFKDTLSGGFKVPNPDGSHFEVYGHNRFMICTGNHIPGTPKDCKPAGEILDKWIDKLHKDVKTGEAVLHIEDNTSVEDIIAKCTEHDYSGSFAAYMSNTHDKKASAADAGLIAIVGFYTQDYEKIWEVWQQSKLADMQYRYDHIGDPVERSAKIAAKAGRIAKPDYRNRTINYALGKNLIDAAKRAKEQSDIADHAAILAANGSFTALTTQSSPAWPPGMAGELARYFFNSSYRPIQPFAILSALAVLSGIAAVAYHYKGTGLNGYYMAFGRTGLGKRDLTDVPERFLTNMARQHGCPDAMVYFRRQNYTHGNMLLKAMAKTRSFIWAGEEAGKVFQEMLRASSSMSTLPSVITSLYDRSGPYGTVSGMDYADESKNITIDHSVGLTLLMESVPEAVLGKITKELFDNGFMNRINFVVYEGERPEDNEDGLLLPIPDHIVNGIAPLIFHAGSYLQDGTKSPVSIQAALDAQKYIKEAKRDENARYNAIDHNDGWALLTSSRFMERTIRVAALLAVADNPETPTIHIEHIKWAETFITSSNNFITGKMQNGEVASGNSGADAYAVLEAVIEKYISGNDPKDAKDGKTPTEPLRSKGIIKADHLKRRMESRNVFKGAPPYLLKSTVDRAIEDGRLVKVSPEKVKEFGLPAKFSGYYING